MDDSFMRLVEEVLTLGNGFGHREHLFLAWKYLRLGDTETAEHRMCEAIRHVTALHGEPDKYHETLTLAWTRMVAAHTRIIGRSSFEELLDDFPDLMNRRLPERHWTGDLLWSDEARRAWREPDLQPLP
jgi:hypothetical protein